MLRANSQCPHVRPGSLARPRTGKPESSNVVARGRCKRKTYWGDIPRRKAAAQEHKMEEGASDPTVTVGERMDRLELSVADCCLKQRRKVIRVEKRDQVLQ